MPIPSTFGTNYGRVWGHSEIDWNQHEWIQGVVKHLINNVSRYSIHIVSYLVLAAERLKLKSTELWINLGKACNKCMHKFAPKSYGYVYISFLSDPTRASQEFREKLANRLPIFLWKMNPILITKCF